MIEEQADRRVRGPAKDERWRINARSHHVALLASGLLCVSGCSLLVTNPDDVTFVDSDGGADAGSSVVDAGVADAGADATVDDGGLELDGGSDAGVTGDAGMGDAGVGLGPWSAPTPVGAAAHALLDKNPTMTADLRLLVWTSNRSGNPDLWMLTRPSAIGAWGLAEPIDELNTTEYEETNPEIAPDGRTLWFVSNRPGGDDGFNIWQSTRPSTDDDWGPAAIVESLSSPGNDSTMGIHESLLVAAVSAERTGGAGLRDIYLYERSSAAGAWGPPSNLLELNTDGQDAAPAITANLLRIYFDTREAAEVHHDLVVAERSSDVAAFGAPTPISELNSPQGDSGMWVSSDERLMFFSSDRSGNWEIYQSER